MRLEEMKNLGTEVMYADNMAGRTELIRQWEGNICRSFLVNSGKAAVVIREVRLFQGKVKLPGNTRFYGEGYNMLSQYEGTVEKPENIGAYSDREHYRLPVREGFHTVYNMALFFDRDSKCDLIGFASCRRFSNEIRLAPGYLELALDMENLVLQSGETWELEEIFFCFGMKQQEALKAFAEAVGKRHPRLYWEGALTGWCSWYAYGPYVTMQDILDTMEAAGKNKIPLRYIQIDDGYQPNMGDWLACSGRFPEGMRSLCRRIREAGYEPAVWAAPFIADKDSRLFREHPDWFLRDEAGGPLASDKVSFGGWRQAPWYMLDATHPDAARFLTDTFRIMAEEWGCHYFKLDALMWGALPFGKRYDGNATRVSAYRTGLCAIRKGCGDNSYLVGANAPMWPSIGELHGMRVANDIARKGQRIRDTAKEIGRRRWQDKALWLNDPDCVLLENISNPVVGAGGEKGSSGCSGLTEEEFSLHKAVILSSSSVVLSGDRLTLLTEEKGKALVKLMEHSGRKMVFADGAVSVGRMDCGTYELLCIFNCGEIEEEPEIPAGNWKIVREFWKNTMVPAVDGIFRPGTVPPHSARVFCLSDEN